VELYQEQADLPYLDIDLSYYDSVWRAATPQRQCDKTGHNRQ